MHADLELLRDHILKYHPGLRWHNSEEGVDSLFQELHTQTNQPLSSEAFYRIAARVNSGIRCVHSDIRPEDTFYTHWKDNARILPIGLQRLGGTYIAINSHTPKIPNGAQIQMINGKTIQTIVAELLPYIPADGSNETRKFAALNLSFAKYYGLFVEPDAEVFRLSYIHDNEVVKVNVNGMTPNTYWHQIDSVRRTQDQKPVKLDIQARKNLAVLTISSFRNDLMTTYGIDYTSTLYQIFKRLNEANIEHLIIDLRGNGGGYSEYGAQLIEHLTNSPFIYCYQMELLTDGSDSTLDYEIPETFEGFPNGLDVSHKPYQWLNHSILNARIPAYRRFDGSVYFLINGGCVSTTSEVATVAHRLKLGTFIGEEVGGSYIGDCGGILGRFKLPNSGINIRLGLASYTIARKSPFGHQGVKPDYEVFPGHTDHKGDSDAVLDFAIQLCTHQEDLNTHE